MVQQQAKCVKCMKWDYIGSGSYLVFSSLALSQTVSSQAVAVMPTWRTISPGEVLGLAHQQTVGCSHSAPQSSARGAQVWAVLGVVAKGQPALMVGVIHSPRQGLGEGLRFDRLVQQALAVAVVQEGGDHERGAGGPRLLLVQVGQGGGHHVRAPVGTIDSGAQLGIIVRHVEDVAWKTEMK